MLSGFREKKSWVTVIFLLSALLIISAPASLYSLGENDCMDCHEAEEPLPSESTQSSLEDVDDVPGVVPGFFKLSAHKNIACLNCHPDAKDDHDDKQVTQKKVQCARCHKGPVEEFKRSIHGDLAAKNDPEAPTCVFCHQPHNDLLKENPKSALFPLNIPKLCARCHKEGEQTALREKSSQKNILKNYSMSIHGKGLFMSGLSVSATCVSCHTAHGELPAKNPLSSVHPDKIAETCSQCHYGIFEKLNRSIHSPHLSETIGKTPTCNNCHSSHQIKNVETSNFRLEITSQCGTCHKTLAQTYFNTYHGKVSRLGMKAAAKCQDCHGSHEIKPKSDPTSTLHPDNIVKTCKKCHPGANERFVTYLPHTSNYDKEKHTSLYYTYWGMTFLLAGTFLIFGLHTLLWLTRSLIEQIAKKKENFHDDEVFVHIRRFKPYQSVMHLIVIVSFLILAITGITLKFSDSPIFSEIAGLLGGAGSMGILHRFFALVTFGYFAAHLFDLYEKLRRKEITLKGLLQKEYSLVPLKRDFIELFENLRWFFFIGPKPRFGRWTYWEKFDYLAVFWGITVIGLSGLILWFPESFTAFLPGWFINLATIVHSDEAILAVGFIFTVHFFNTHFRPEKFPMDPVIFTGRMTLKQFKEERPREYDELQRDGKLDSLFTKKPKQWFLTLTYVSGLSFLGFGIFIILFILYAVIYI
ncbi:MAG: hypothetical protein OEY59_04770 [Deltaproteobacteria bacterium]|nr:hypothetical protein [Deltaproteobacteria bacterium]